MPNKSSSSGNYCVRIRARNTGNIITGLVLDMAGTIGRRLRFLTCRQSDLEWDEISRERDGFYVRYTHETVIVIRLRRDYGSD